MEKGSKRCKGCNTVKEISDFYYRPKKSWYDTFCKDCRRAQGREYETTEHRKELHRKRRYETRSDDVNRARERRSSAKYRAKHPEKELAKRTLNRAIKSGVILKPYGCERCDRHPVMQDGKSGLQAHHHDYNRPLDVVWLCYLCHAKEHSALKRSQE